MGLSMSSDYVIFVVGGIALIMGWFINLVKNLASKRIDDLDELHKKNFQSIVDVDKRLTKIEDSYVTKLDLKELLDILRDDINNDVNKSFRRLHDRMDEAAYCTRVNADDSVDVVKKRASDRKSPGHAS